MVSKQGKLRLAKWYTSYNLKERQRLVKDVSHLVLNRKGRLCNFIEYKGLFLPVLAWFAPPLICCPSYAGGCVDMKIVYKRYASLFFITGIDEDDNELLTLEVIHRYVETLDRYFENVKH